MSFRSASLSLVLVFAVSFSPLFGQTSGGSRGASTNEGIGKTWKGPSPTVTARLFIRSSARPSGKPATRPANRASDTVVFRPAGDSGVARSLADALSSDPSTRSGLLELFRGLKASYESEIARDGKSNDLAAAMTFFITSSLTAYNGRNEISDAAAEEFYASVRDSMRSSPEFSKMTNAEKQQMHDWLVLIGGFGLASFMDASQNNNAEGLENARQFAGYALQIVLGSDPAKLSFSNGGLAISEGPAAAASPATNTAIVGVWSMSASSPAGTDLVTNAGSVRRRYTFNPNGTYDFKSEIWGGYMNSNTWWTTEETGTYTVGGNSLTVVPKSCTATLRNLSGVVQKRENKPLEKTTYGFSFHFFEGLGENYLILSTPRETARDGKFSSLSDFPNSYGYTSRNNLEFRY